MLTIKKTKKMNLIIEMGGTKINFFVVQDNQIHSKFSIPTTTPDDFKKHVVEDFKGKLIDQIILGCFGPLSLSKNNYGEILNTPKKNWRNINIYKWLKDNICDDIILFSDVALPALGAMKKYRLQGKFFTYITVGTGIGGCNIFKGMILQNEFHPEMGHMYLGDSDAKICEYHSHCFENQSSGNYFFSRYNLKFKDIDTSSSEWSEMIGKLSILIYNLYSTMGIEYVVLGGGLIREDMKSQLLAYLKEYNNSYLPVLNERDFDQRLILDSNSDDLSVEGGLHCLNDENIK
jgi:fructokinase